MSRMRYRPFAFWGPHNCRERVDITQAVWGMLAGEGSLRSMYECLATDAALSGLLITRTCESLGVATPDEFAPNLLNHAIEVNL
jgi:hypothetical protein